MCPRRNGQDRSSPMISGLPDGSPTGRLVCGGMEKHRGDFPNPTGCLLCAVSENDLDVEVVLNLGDLSPEDIGVEMLFAASDRKRQLYIQDKCEFKVVESNDGIVRYQASILPERAGMYQVAIRMYAKYFACSPAGFRTCKMVIATGFRWCPPGTPFGRRATCQGGEGA